MAEQPYETVFNQAESYLAGLDVTLLADDFDWYGESLDYEASPVGSDTIPSQGSDPAILNTATQYSTLPITGDQGTLHTSIANRDAWVSEDLALPSPAPNLEPPSHKPGQRFPSSAVKVLRDWLSSHIQNPYPKVGDVEILERRSGLRRQQILTWFANARRRQKFQPPQTSTVSALLSGDHPPPRPPTPSVVHMNPLQRWQNSPPEHDPVNTFALEQAAASFSSDPDTTNTRWMDGDAASSVCSSTGGSSRSSQSQSSVYSFDSQTSRKSFRQLRKTKRRRKRTTALTEDSRLDPLLRVRHPFQCTFCTETFKTKYVWQRHEKSLHLSLEQWECSPNGPTETNAQSQPVCAFCSLVNPDPSHLESHNERICRERPREERIFTRKDHLLQHLRLMHDAQFTDSMKHWKLEDDCIQSRCGFCNLSLHTWEDRVDHLADHFKNGSTMAEWSGDWGFESLISNMVENAIPPYLIHYEQNSPLPFTTRQGPPDIPGDAFELLQVELEYFFANYSDVNRHGPSSERLQYEACCIIFGAEVLPSDTTAPSWLRDLIISNDHITGEARLRPMKDSARSRLTSLSIHGKSNIFDKCPLEAQLREYVDAMLLLDLDIGDDQLQEEACQIMYRMPNSSSIFVKLLVGLANSSTGWLAPFRRRAKLIPVESAISSRAADQTTSQVTMSGSNRPDQSDDHLHRLGHDLQQHAADSLRNAGSFQSMETSKVAIFNEGNMHRGLARGLSRFVASVTSPYNPTRHIPTDDELQHQARWIMFDDDDPWNQTPADNPDWIREFKASIGL